MPDTAKQGPLSRWIRTRPLTLAAACFIAGLLAARHTGAPVWLWAGLCAPAAALALCLGPKRRMARLAIMLMLIPALCGALRMSAAMRKPAVQAAENVMLRGTVASDARVGDGQIRVCLRGVTLDGEAAHCRVMAYLYGVDEAPAYGSEVVAFANVWIPRSAGDPGAFDYSAWLWRQGVALCATISRGGLLDIVPPTGFSLVGWSLAARARVATVIRGAFSEKTRGLALALVLGDRSELPEEVYDSYKQTGAAHILAISGLHVGLLFALMSWLLRRAGLRRQIAFVITIPLFFLYALMVGLPASVLRAGIMYIAVGCARMDGRPGDGLTALSLAALSILIVSPLYIEDVGFVLSCSAMAGILALSRSRRRKPKTPAARRAEKVLNAARTALGAQLGALPATAGAYHMIPLVALPLNLVMVTGLTVLFPLVLAATALCAVLPGLMWPVARAADAFILLMDKLAEAGASLYWARVDTPSWPGWLIALWAALGFLISPYARFGRGRGRKAALALALAAVFALSLGLPALTARDGLEVVFLDAGYADAAVIVHRNEAWLVDAGSDDTALQYLLHRGLRPKGVILSQSGDQYSGGLGALVERFPGLPVYTSRLWSMDDAGERAAEGLYAAMAARCPITGMMAGDSMTLWEGVTVRVLWPDAGSITEYGRQSLLCELSYAGRRALLCGGLAPVPAEADLRPCDILKVGHNGSKKALDGPLLTLTEPEIAVISVGRNRYGHPSAAALDALSGVAVYRTDLCGAVTVNIAPDGGMAVSTFRP